jgi:hypothetical protein
MADSALQARGNCFYPDSTTDLTGAIGKLLTFTGGVPAVNTSTSVPAVAVVVDARKRTPISGGATYYDNTLAILGRTPPIRALLSATSAPLNFGDMVQQAADGTVTKDLGPTNTRVVVGVCTDLNGAQPGDLFEISTFDGDYRT